MSVSSNNEIKTFCRYGHEEEFADSGEFVKYLTDNGFVNAHIVEWSKSKINAYMRKEHSDRDLTDLLREEDLRRLAKGEELFVIEHDGCYDEADLGLEFVFINENTKSLLKNLIKEK